MKKIIPLSLFAIALTGCSGINHNDDIYTAHAESFNIVGLQIPGNTKDRVMKLVPEDATVDTVQSSNTDTTSFLGILNRIFGLEYVQVGGQKK